MQNVGQVTGKKRVNVGPSKNNSSSGGGGGIHKKSSSSSSNTAASGSATQATVAAAASELYNQLPGRQQQQANQLTIIRSISEQTTTTTTPRVTESESDEESVSEVMTVRAGQGIAPGYVGAMCVKWGAGPHRPDDHTCSPTCSTRQIPLSLSLSVYLCGEECGLFWRGLLTYIFNSERTKRNQLQGIQQSIGDVIMHFEDTCVLVDTCNGS